MKKKSLGSRVGLAALYAAGIAAIGLVLGSGLIRCPFAAMTHTPCPGCGSTRAVLALLHLHVGEAMRFNPTAPIIAICIGVLTVEGLWMVVRDGHARDLAVNGPGRWAIRGIVVAVMLQFPIWALRFFGLFGGPVPV
jgi:Protein of unknown function (DUF2752)